MTSFSALHGGRRSGGAAGLGGAMTRRRFLQSAAAAGIVGAGIPSWMRDMAGASSIAGGDGILVVVSLLGGCDPLDVLTPIAGPDRSRYEAMRGSIALPVAGVRAIDETVGFAGPLERLTGRYAAGDVAVVRGTGLAALDRSHFSATARMAAARPDGGVGTGWLGRWLDARADPAPFAAISAGSYESALLRNDRSEIACMPSSGTLWGSDTRDRFERAAMDAVRAFDDGAGSGPWEALIGSTATLALERAELAGGLIAGIASGSSPVGRDLALVAGALNADIGTRVATVAMSGFDTHASQHTHLPGLLGQLDAAIDGFFALLSPDLASRVVVLVESEFGRTVSANASHGTDHGHGGFTLLVGQNVAGGLHGEAPPLDALGPHATLATTVDHRAVKATVLERWLGADAGEILGRTFPQHDLFAASPGA